MKVQDIAGEADYKDICQIVMHRTGQDYETVRTIIDTEWDVLAEVLAIHERYEHNGVGVLKLEDRAARHSNTPDGESWETPERREVEFHASPAFAEKVQGFTGEETPII